MDNQWKDEACGTCYFVVKWSKMQGNDILSIGSCRQSPPSRPPTTQIQSQYPTVLSNNPACSCWKEKEK